MKQGIAIVGKGMAAMVLSFLLEKKGIPHLILERRSSVKGFELAETLPPSALPLLQELGLLKLFEQHSIRKTFGYHSLWATDELTDNNFYFQHPFKYGLKIDKNKIVQALEQKASAEVISFDHYLNIQPNTSGVTIKYRLANEVKKLEVAMVIDATGRSRAVLSALGIPTIDHDKTISFTAHLDRQSHDEVKHDVLVEAFADGWGLVSGLNEKTNVVSIFPDRRSSIFLQCGNYRNWPSILKDTKYLKHFLTQQPVVKVRGCQSNSSRPEQMADKHWLAIGDAAMAFDPLCSHGVTNAIYTAKLASETISKTLAGAAKEGVLANYAATLSDIFATYLKSREMLYLQKKSKRRYAENWS